MPVYLHERVGNQSVQGVRAENVFIGVAFELPVGAAIRTPFAGTVTTYELSGGGGGGADDVLGTGMAFSTTPREALIKTDVFSPDGHRLILRIGGTLDLQFDPGLFVIDQPVAAGDVIARAGTGGESLRLAWGQDVVRNLVVWAEWDVNPAGDVVAEWFPHLMAEVAGNGHLEPRRYKTEGDDTVVAVNVANPARGLLPTVLFLHDEGDGPEAARELITDVDGAVSFAASWRAPDLTDAGSFQAGIHDVACLLRYLRSEGHRYGADPDRVTIAGHGAGGTAAVAAALSRQFLAEMPQGLCAYWNEPAAITSAVAVGGFFDLPSDGSLHPALATVFEPPAADDGIWFGFVLSDGDAEADPAAAAAAADTLAAVGYGTEIRRAEGDHDQLLNASHPLQGIPAVRALEKAIEAV
jgi:hypothetical protein